MIKIHSKITQTVWTVGKLPRAVFLVRTHNSNKASECSCPRTMHAWGSAIKISGSWRFRLSILNSSLVIYRSQRNTQSMGSLVVHEKARGGLGRNVHQETVFKCLLAFVGAVSGSNLKEIFGCQPWSQLDKRRQ